MIRVRLSVTSVILGILVGSQMAWAEGGPTLDGKGNIGVSLQSELVSRKMKLNGPDERERVTRETVRLSYGVMDNLDVFALFGTGNIIFEDSDLKSRNRPVLGAGFRSTVPFSNGYYGGFSWQLLAGQVSKFEQGGTTVSLEDKWHESDARLFVGTRDLISDPEPDLRFYTGLKFSNREDKLTPQGGPTNTATEVSSLGVLLGMSFSDRGIFRFDTEVGTGDSNNITVRLGLIF